MGWVVLFWGDHAADGSDGIAFYREVTDAALLTSLSDRVKEYHCDADYSFTATWAVIATWDRVPSYDERTTCDGECVRICAHIVCMV